MVLPWAGKKLPPEEFMGKKLRDKIKDYTEWVPKKKAHIRVIEEKCTGCGLCAMICPGGCWAIKNGKAVIETLETCYECGACYHICKYEAIEWSYPEGGTGVVFKYS